MQQDSGNGAGSGANAAPSPIASLISKSEKAQQKLDPGSWQHKLLQQNLDALRYATALMADNGALLPAPSASELERYLLAFTDMIDRTEQVFAKARHGSAQHSLLRNRLTALRLAKAAVEATL